MDDKERITDLESHVERLWTVVNRQGRLLDHIGVKVVELKDRVAALESNTPTLELKR